MMLSFTLPNGTRAGIVPTSELQRASIEQLGLRCLPPTNSAPIVFYVSNREALDRLKAKFGLMEC
jgi:hypothetical protein